MADVMWAEKETTEVTRTMEKDGSVGREGSG